MKKATELLIVLCLLMSLCLTAFAAEVYTERTFEYTLAEESVTIVGYFGRDAEVTVPAMIAGYPVNTIAAGAFTGASIRTVYLPDTVTTIEGGAIRSGISVVYNANVAPGESIAEAPENSQSAAEPPAVEPETTVVTEPAAPSQIATEVGEETDLMDGAENADLGVSVSAGDDSVFVGEEEVELDEAEILAAQTVATEPAPTETAEATKMEAPQAPAVQPETHSSILPWVVAAVCAAAAAVFVILRKKTKGEIG